MKKEFYGPGMSDLDLLHNILGEKGVAYFRDNQINPRIISRMSIAELQNIPGVGSSKAIEMASLFNMAARPQEDPSKITSSKNAFELLYPRLYNLETEAFYVIYCNRANHVIKIKQTSQGGISGTVADIRIILAYALEKRATGIILAHNHPSGNLTPSEADIKLTQKIKQAALVMDIAVLDHIIVTSDPSNYYSFTDEGKI